MPALACLFDCPLPPLSPHLRRADIVVQWHWDGQAQAVVGTIAFGPHTVGLPDYVHGGLATAICDEAMGWACWMSGHVAPGAMTQSQFEQPLRAGGSATLRASIDKVDGRKLHTQATLHTERGVAVRASGVYISIIPPDWRPFAHWPASERFAQLRPSE